MFFKQCFSNFVLIALYSFTQDCTRETIESLAYTIKEINAVAGCSTYTVGALSCPASFQVIQEVWTKVFVNADVLFAAVKTTKQGTYL